MSLNEPIVSKGIKPEHNRGEGANREVSRFFFVASLEFGFKRRGVGTNDTRRTQRFGLTDRFNIWPLRLTHLETEGDPSCGSDGLNPSIWTVATCSHSVVHQCVTSRPLKYSFFRTFAPVFVRVLVLPLSSVRPRSNEAFISHRQG